MNIDYLAYKRSWLVYLQPYTNLYKQNKNEVSISLEQINNNDYNGELFSKVISKITLPQSNIDILISYDGGFMIPQNEQFPSVETAAEAFNKLFACFLLANFETGVIYPKDILVGTLLNNWG